MERQCDPATDAAQIEGEIVDQNQSDSSNQSKEKRVELAGSMFEGNPGNRMVDGTAQLCASKDSESQVEKAPPCSFLTRSGVLADKRINNDISQHNSQFHLFCSGNKLGFTNWDSSTKTENDHKKLSGKNRVQKRSNENNIMQRQTYKPQSRRVGHRRKKLIKDLKKKVRFLSKSNTEMEKHNDRLKLQLERVLHDNHSMRLQSSNTLFHGVSLSPQAVASIETGNVHVDELVTQIHQFNNTPSTVNSSSKQDFPLSDVCQTEPQPQKK